MAIILDDVDRIIELLTIALLIPFVGAVVMFGFVRIWKGLRK